MNSTLPRTLAGAALLAAGMYLFDPDRGRRRRALLRDRLFSVAARADDALGVMARDTAHRLKGLAARARTSFGDGTADDDVVVERVRACMGRVVSHPSAIKTSVSEGRVVLRGDVLASEHRALLSAVRSVRGVKETIDELGVHETARGISALQGGRPRERRAELFQENWSPATRMLTGTSGMALLYSGLRLRSPLGLLTIVAGGALLARSLSNVPIGRLAGLSGRRAIDIRKTLYVEAPLYQVFETLAQYENFPAFMRNVRHVRELGNGRSHWVVSGPADIAVEWDSETTAYRPNELLAWRTVRNASIAHAGIIRFEQAGSGTRLHIQMTYNPPAGAAGHIVARLFGSDPKSELDQDLMRLKTYLETGVTPRDAARPATAERSPISPAPL
jgi:uncharacterized membrane protein